MIQTADPYRTRLAEERAAESEIVTPRVDPVVHGEATPGPLSREDVARYETDGYLFVESLFSPADVQAYVAEMNRLRSDPALRKQDETITEPGSDQVRSIFRVHQLSPVFAALARDARVAGVARQILGDEVYIHQSRVNFKPGFTGKEFYWHSDFETWHAEDGMPRPRALSASILLTDNSANNGPVMVMPRSHKQFVACAGETPDQHYKDSLKKQEYGVPDEASLTLLAKEGGIAAPTGPAGSVLFFDSNLMHGSNSNITPYPRSNVFYVYNSVTNAVVDPFYAKTPRPTFIATRAVEPL